VESFRVAFINVGQGDCTLVRSDGWTALVDGGTATRVEPYRDFFRGIERIDLMVGTHFDADHLGGLAHLLEGDHLPGGVGHTLLPPHVHPLGDTVPIPVGPFTGFGAASPFLADHFAAGQRIADVYRGVEARARAAVTGLDAQVADLTGGKVRRVTEVNRDCLTDERSDQSLDDGAGRLRDAVRLAYENGLTSIGALLDFAAAMESKPIPQQLGVRTGDPWTGSRLRSVAAGASFLTREVISASSLARLVVALKAKGLAWSVDAAPDRATSLVGTTPSTKGPELWHLAPTRRYVARYPRELEATWDKALRLLVVDNERPTLSNRLSHVIYLRHERFPSHGLLLTGDAGFDTEKRPPADSMADGWDKAIRQVSLIDLPHHGGNWGPFGSRILRALDATKGPLTLHAGVRANDSQPPSAQMRNLVLAFSDGNRRRPLEILLANRSKPEVLGSLADVLPAGPDGPAIVELTQAGDGWDVASLDARGQPSTKEPILGIVPIAGP
jgi:glyoxylase-like metal-dependent hydrolase (beta-lactamase superfamily II)